jgi:hypothetical protein
VVSLSSSRTENAPKEESILARKRKARREGKAMYTNLISFPPKKQITKPTASKISDINHGFELRYWIKPEALTTPQPEL